MHCLWVYFLGEYIIKKPEFEPFFHNYGKENANLKKVFALIKEKNYTDLFSGWLCFDDMFEMFDSYSDSIRCLGALTHDLGYPIKKINSINKNIKNILPHFGIKNFSEFDFSYSDIHDNFIKDFLNFLSYKFSIDFSDIKKSAKVLYKIFNLDEKGFLKDLNEEGLSSLTDDEKDLVKECLVPQTHLYFSYSGHMTYSKDFENYQHGIMSAFLLFRKLSVFNNKRFEYSNLSDLRVSFSDYIKLNTLSAILKSITDHNSDGFRINSIIDDSAFLTFIDELEEFSRISRANQNRQYINEFCKSNIYVEDEYLNVDFIFDNEEIDNLDPEKAFKGRCKRFLTLFNIDELDEKLKLKLKCVGKLPYDQNVYMLEIRNKFANITINDEEKNIPQYLKSNQFLTKEAYML